MSDAMANAYANFGAALSSPDRPKPRLPYMSKSIIGSEELADAVESVLQRPMDEAELGRFEAWVKHHDNPRRTYGEIDTLESLSFWLVDAGQGGGLFGLGGGYELVNFGDGVGISPRIGGGCYGYLAIPLLEQMERDGLIADGQFGWKQLTGKGWATLRRISAEKVLGVTA